MTRQEQTGYRDLTFSGWVRENLPDSSTGFMASDLDFILWNYKTRKLMLLEVKTHKAKMRVWQQKLFTVLDQILQKGCVMLENPIEYLGFHCVRFENTDFYNGRCMLDDSIVTEQELIQFLSMED
jgi:hypothetical protein